MRKFLCVVAMLCSSPSAYSHEYMNFEEVTAAFGMDFENTEIRAEEVGPGLHVLFGAGGNVLVSVGEQGVLMVDSQFPQMIPKLEKAVSNLGGDGIDFTINTHWHFDHADGNPVLGRQGTWIVAQSNSRRMMAGAHPIDLVNLAYLQPPYPTEAMPVISFTDHMQFHLNGNTIDLLHFGPAHTTGDTAVLFLEANIVHMGDVFNATYPFIDAGNGGDIEGMIRFCRKVLERLDTESVVIPGHGPVMGYEAFADYIDMLETISSRISAMIDAGMSLEQVMKANPTAGYDEQYGDPATLVNRAYTSLSR